MPVQIGANHKQIVIFDIDGCVIDSEERLPHLLAGDRKTYHALHHTDKLMHAGHVVYRALLKDPELLCLFVTGRCETGRDFTLRQLQAIFGAEAFHPTQLLMRPEGCVDHDRVLKPALIQARGHRIEDILLVFEDRNDNVAEWRELGVTCYQTQVGDF